MKKWFDYFIFHAVSGASVIMLLLASALFGRFIIGFIPFLKVQTFILFQLVAFVPFFMIVPKEFAKRTREYLPENSNYYTAFGAAQFPLLMSMLCVLIAYVNLKTSGIQETMIAELNTMTNFEGGYGLIGPLVGILLNILGGIPTVIIESLDNIILNFFFYLCMVLAMMVGVEKRRLSLVYQGG